MPARPNKGYSLLETSLNTPPNNNMALKLVVFCCAVAVSSVRGSVPAAAAVAVRLARLEEYDPLPQYRFGYNVADSFTGDYKSQTEQRDGDIVQGSYSLVDPDGTRRVVNYIADPVNGFNAEVRKEPLVAAAPAVVAQPAVVAARYAQPVAPAPVYTPAGPVFARYAAPVAAAPAPVLARYTAAPVVAGPLAARYAAGPVVAARYAVPAAPAALRAAVPAVYNAAYTAPVAASYAAPVAAAYSAPVAAAYSAPVAAAYSAPVAAAYSAPVATAYSAPVAATYSAPVAAAYSAPVAAAYSAPVAAAYSAPVAGAYAAPARFVASAAPVARAAPAKLVETVSSGYP